VSNCGYIIFNFLNLNAAGSPHRQRPYQPAVEGAELLLGLGAIFAYVNAIFMGAGAKVWKPDGAGAGLNHRSLDHPVFCYRHYIQDKGKFPDHMLADLGMTGADLAVKKARHAALSDAGRRRGGDASRQLVFRHLTPATDKNGRASARRFSLHNLIRKASAGLADGRFGASRSDSAAASGRDFSRNVVPLILRA